MIPVLSTSESRRLDEEAAEPVGVLMERAGWAVGWAAAELGAGYGTRVSVLVGPGNNGGDGWVSAGVLAGRGCRVTCHEFAEPRTDAARTARSVAIRRGVVAESVETRVRADIVIDAVFGSGIRGDLPEWFERWTDASTVVAAHVPSGLDPETGVAAASTIPATVTVAFHALSPGHLIGAGPDVCGEVRIADIGLQDGAPSMQVVTADDAMLPVRPRTAHKWSVGSVLVVGGSPGMIGAPILTAKSALAFGAGSVGLVVPDSHMDSAELLAPEILSYRQAELPERFDVIVAGPGMASETRPLEHVLAHEGPIVLDADALTSDLLDRISDRSGSTVLTPHAGELERLTGEPPTWQSADEFAKSLGAVVVFKGNPTFVCAAGVPRVITANGRELASIGTGDVLAGMIGTAIARGMDPVDGASAATYWHGVAAADLATETTVTANVLASFVGRYAGTTP